MYLLKHPVYLRLVPTAHFTLFTVSYSAKNSQKIFVTFYNSLRKIRLHKMELETEEKITRNVERTLQRQRAM